MLIESMAVKIKLPDKKWDYVVDLNELEKGVSPDEATKQKVMKVLYGKRVEEPSSGGKGIKSFSKEFFNGDEEQASMFLHWIGQRLSSEPGFAVSTGETSCSGHVLCLSKINF